MVRVFNCSEMVDSRGNGHGKNGWGIVSAIRPSIEGRPLDRVQGACVSSKMQKGTDDLRGSQHLENRSGSDRRDEGLNDAAQASAITQAKFILRDEPARVGRHSLVDPINLVPVGSGRGKTRENNDTSGQKNGAVARVAASSGAFSRMHQTDGQLDGEASKCKTKTDKMNGQMDKSNDEQCKLQNRNKWAGMF